MLIRGIGEPFISLCLSGLLLITSLPRDAGDGVSAAEPLPNPQTPSLHLHAGIYSPRSNKRHKSFFSPPLQASDGHCLLSRSQHKGKCLLHQLQHLNRLTGTMSVITAGVCVCVCVFLRSCVLLNRACAVSHTEERNS